MLRNRAILFVFTSTVAACGSEAYTERDVSNEEFGSDAVSLGIQSQVAAKSSPSLLDIERYKNLGSNRCMRDGPANGLHAGPCSGDSHKWRVNRIRSNIIQFINVLTGDCIDDSTSRGLRAIGCHDDGHPDRAHQRWRVDRYDDGSIRFQNADTGLCIEERRGDIVHDACSSGSLQRWK